MLDDFLVRAALAGLGTAITAGLLGCFVVWRRMAYFGDAMAHAAILGVALSLGFSVSIFIGVIVTAIAVAFLFLGLTGRGQSADAALGVIAHGGLALGLVAVALLPGQRISLDAYLFGDVLTVSCLDLAVIWGGALVVFVIIWHRWSALLTATLSPDLAHAAGIKPRREELILTLLLAFGFGRGCRHQSGGCIVDHRAFDRSSRRRANSCSDARGDGRACDDHWGNCIIGWLEDRNDLGHRRRANNRVYCRGVLCFDDVGQPT
jgi:hypothetical protein